MVFDSFEFVIFFIAVYFIYLCLKHRSQNIFLLGASYFFYGFWSWKFLALLVATQIVDFHISKGLNRLTDPAARKKLMWLSVVVNMGTLAFFKYFNFFTENLQEVTRFFGMPVSEFTLNVVLPVGISFYTIQEMTYIIDVYKKRVKPADKFIDFALFVSYFPQLVAGPIERAERLMPQVQNPRRIRRADILSGGWFIYWGLFKKMFVADRLALIVDPVFAAPEAASASMFIVAAVAFTVQIYADFSGYSDMAIGLGRLMGFRLMYNFNLPFFAVSPSDFWKRWHISLSQCLRDNLYIPMGGNRKGFPREVFALMATMLIGGLWHGAQWHFVIWGGYCGILLVLQRIIERTFSVDLNLPDNVPPYKPRRLLQAAVMFALTVFGFVIFRVEQARDIGTLLTRLVTGWSQDQYGILYAKEFLFCTALFAFIQCIHYFSGNRLIVFRFPWPARVAIYFIIYLFLALAAPHDIRQFIYFQF